jgi:hypothetical protein
MSYDAKKVLSLLQTYDESHPLSRHPLPLGDLESVENSQLDNQAAWVEKEFFGQWLHRFPVQAEWTLLDWQRAMNLWVSNFAETDITFEQGVMTVTMINFIENFQYIIGPLSHTGNVSDAVKQRELDFYEAFFANFPLWYWSKAELEQLVPSLSGIRLDHDEYACVNVSAMIYEPRVINRHVSFWGTYTSIGHGLFSQGDYDKQVDSDTEYVRTHTGDLLITNKHIYAWDDDLNTMMTIDLRNVRKISRAEINADGDRIQGVMVSLPNSSKFIEIVTDSAKAVREILLEILNRIMTNSAEDNYLAEVMSTDDGNRLLVKTLPLLVPQAPEELSATLSQFIGHEVIAELDTSSLPFVTLTVGIQDSAYSDSLFDLVNQGQAEAFYDAIEWWKDLTTDLIVHGVGMPQVKIVDYCRVQADGNAVCLLDSGNDLLFDHANGQLSELGGCYLNAKRIPDVFAIPEDDDSTSSSISATTTNHIKTDDPFAVIRQYKALMDEGVITPEEFAKKKAKLLDL